MLKKMLTFSLLMKLHSQRNCSQGILLILLIRLKKRIQINNNLTMFHSLYQQIVKKFITIRLQMVFRQK
jgi:hypothetical protein